MALADTALDALGSSTRREIVCILADGPRAVGAIADELPVSRPAVSKHLRILQEAQLVDSASQGTRNIFRLRRDGFVAAESWMQDFWDDALTRFRLLAENTDE